LEPETTNIRVIDPTTHLCPPPARVPASMRTTTAAPRPLCSALPPPPRPLCGAPTATIVVGNTMSPFPSVASAATWQLLHHHHFAPEHHLAYRSPIKLPHQLPQFPSQAKHMPDKSPCQITSKSIFHSLAPEITMLGDSWVEDGCTWFIVFGFLLCMMVILFDRILQWEEQRERKRQ
jgi:hypothetical protein